MSPIDRQRCQEAFRFMKDGRVHISLSFSCCAVRNTDNFEQFFQDWRYGDDFTRECIRLGLSGCVAVDLTLLHFQLRSCLERYSLLCDRVGLSFPISTHLRLHGIKDRIPFLDIPTFENFWKEHGLPICETNNAVVPSEFDNGVVHLVDNEPGLDSEFRQDLWAFVLLGHATRCFGFPSEFILGQEERDLGSLREPLTRAANVQRRRISSLRRR